ncbi:uncharacterized protein LOC134197607 isoform X2 [Corticium candelabrum]|uniref:uncharacterized protein LOC134197607 isoform X2 n=1 Tax=Corticium candelabrum TaxID=121492 RepID=UPI002E2600DB|nr:uncharacterized protein LOC134197607 isoform X2 [Corticium candelabrum]XP_062522941.1 uncharacterized protein LOC134197607 isoform X2 [Corticium candelabrum]
MSLRTLTELCDHGEEEAMQQLKQIHKCFSRPLSTVYVEKQDTRVMAPPSSLPIVGRCPVINFKPSGDHMCKTCAKSKGRHHPHLNDSNHSLNSGSIYQSFDEGDNQFAFDTRYLRSESPWSVYLDAVGGSSSVADAQSDTASVAGEEYHTVKHDTSDSGESIFSRADKTEQNETVIPESDGNETDTNTDFHSHQGSSVLSRISKSPANLALTGKHGLPLQCYADHIDYSPEKKPALLCVSFDLVLVSALQAATWLWASVCLNHHHSTFTTILVRKTSPCTEVSATVGLHLNVKLKTS